MVAGIGCAAAPTSGAPPPETAPPPPAATPPAAPGTARFIVSFISPGDGTDHEAEAKLRDLIADRTELGTQRIDWGKEGETDYCFSLAGLSAGGQRAFIAEVDSLIGGRPKVRLMENEPCRQGR